MTTSFREDIEGTVKQVLIEELGCPAEDVVSSAKLVDDLGADSLDAVELSMALEEAFEIVIDDSAIEKLETVQQVVDFCRKEVIHEQTK
jgi:acyl carrier protein